MPDYVTVDLKITHQMKKLLLSMAVNNLFDEKYFSYAIRNVRGHQLQCAAALASAMSGSPLKYQFN